MPELPEVETIRQGLEPAIKNQLIDKIIIYQSQLRWPVDPDMDEFTRKKQIINVKRRGKYLLIQLDNGHIIIHLGMSGCLKLVDHLTPLAKHDHVDIFFQNNQILRYHDPRRFGSIHWTPNDPNLHPLLNKLGPEPLGHCFTVNHLHERAKNRSQSIKLFLMDSQVVAGIGNIYANEILFKSGISPRVSANKISKNRLEKIIEQTKSVLTDAIAQGGTTLKDFFNSEGKPGYFKQSLLVYGREGLPCTQCGQLLKIIRQGQRKTVYCNQCQT